MVDVHSEEYILGQNIRKYRIQKGWSQKQLSDAVNIDRAEISRIENGERGAMSCTMLRRFAKALGVLFYPKLKRTAASLPNKNQRMLSRILHRT